MTICENVTIAASDRNAVDKFGAAVSIGIAHRADDESSDVNTINPPRITKVEALQTPSVRWIPTAALA